MLFKYEYNLSEFFLFGSENENLRAHLFDWSLRIILNAYCVTCTLLGDGDEMVDERNMILTTSMFCFNWGTHK